MVEHGSLGGFFDTEPEIMPDITAQSAYEVINNRLKAFSINKKRIEFINFKAIDKLYTELKRKKPYIHYRMLIGETISCLKNKDFTILKHNFLEIDQKTLSEIESNLKLVGIIDKINNCINSLNERKNGINIINLISSLFIKDGISETDQLFIGDNSIKVT